MGNPLVRSLRLIDTSGVVIIAAILALLVVGVLLTLFIRARYASIGRELRRRGDAPAELESHVLQQVVQDVVHAARSGSEVNAQAIVEQAFHTELRGLLVGERFVRSLTGLMIILGLVGTFYGLSSSIGRLTALLSGKVSAETDVASSLTQGLTETLSGMSVAFSSSLFGIVSAIVMTLLGVFLSIADRRTDLLVQIESYVDNVLLASVRGVRAAPVAEAGGAPSTARLEGVVRTFQDSVARLEGAVSGFETALITFSSSTRDFREFNHHLKDNIQRMSLSFGDLGDALKQQAAAISAARGHDRG